MNRIYTEERPETRNFDLHRLEKKKFITFKLDLLEVARGPSN